MAKKPITREDLLAQLENLDNSTEIGKLKADLATVTAERDSLVSQRRELERQLKQERDALQLVRDAIRTVDVRTRSYGNDRHAELAAAAARSSRLEMAEVRAGIAKGTHDPTGLPYTAETKPVRDLTAGAAKVSKTELEGFFPSLSGPEVDVTTTADELVEAELGELKSALEIAGA